MNKNLFAFSLGGCLMLALTGCESARTAPSATAPPWEIRALEPAPAVSTEQQLLTAAAAQPPAAVTGEGWRPLFDGRSLQGWRVTEFDSGGRVEVQQGLLVFWAGDPFVGVNYTNPVPTVNYEVTFEAMRVAGSDFFCGFTFPVRDSHCSLILGGWGGGVVGISSIDGADASENETSQYVTFETGRWYRIRVRVSEPKIEAWIEQKKIVDLLTAGRKINTRFGDIELSKPFGLASWSTSSAFRGIRIRNVEGPDSSEK